MTIAHVPIRTCLGCGQQRPQKELVRICVKDMVLTVDEGARLPGRGAYLCPQRGCADLLLKKRGRLAHSLRVSVPRDKEEAFVRGLRQAWGEEGRV
jgi:hypothetical protein